MSYGKHRDSDFVSLGKFKTTQGTRHVFTKKKIRYTVLMLNIITKSVKAQSLGVVDTVLGSVVVQIVDVVSVK